jgi:glycosyltransferase involved in cell wall biosynthesis
MSDPRTLIIIPALDEAAALPGVLADLRAAVPTCDVLVVDDGSVDDTAAVAEEAGATVARLPFNLGIGGALRTGFRFALRNGYERAVQFDADGQHDATEIARLIQGLDDGADMVIGGRFVGEEISYDVGRVRSGAMRLLRLAVTVLAGRRFSDTSSGFRAFSRPVLELFARKYPAEYMDSVEALLLACYAGFDVVEVPTRMRQRQAGSASNRSFKLVYHYLRLLIVMAATAPVGGLARRKPA